MAAVDLRLRARRAYESGRLGSALLRSVWLVPAAFLSLLCCSSPRVIVASAAALTAAVTFCLWRGQGWGRGVRPGLLAGAIPMIAPAVASLGGHHCGSACNLYSTVCLLAGAAGGLALAALAPAPRESRGIPLLSACLIAGLAGSVGCLIFGLIGVAGMAAGLVAGALPVMAGRLARG